MIPLVTEFRQEAASQEGQIFHGEQLTWHRPVGRNSVGCGSSADAVMFFAAYTAASSDNASNSN